MICGLVLHWAPARTRKTPPKTGLKVVVTLVCLWGPRGPQRVPGEGQKPPEGRKTRRIAVIFKKLLKTSFLEMCTPLDRQAHVGHKEPPTERQSQRTAVFFVVALQMARGSPKGRKNAPASFWKALPGIGPKLNRRKPYVLRGETAFGPKMGALSFQKTMCLSNARGLFETWKSWEREAS